MTHRIVLLPGDGVGPEVMAAARLVLEEAGKKFGLAFAFEEHLFGGAAIDAAGEPLPKQTLDACLGAKAILLGAVGGPKWDGAPKRPEQGLLGLRKALGVYANLRPMRVLPGMEQYGPLKPELSKGADLLIVRELTGGTYFGERTEGRERATDETVYTREEVERVARIAFEAARGRKGRVLSVDKANVMATSRLWRAAVTDLWKRDYEDVKLDHGLVDAVAMKLVLAPASFDVILTENMFGDILSDEASVIAGSIGLSPSASLGGAIGLYEPIHGSAPDIAGLDKANPTGAILSAAMLARHSLGAEDVAAAMESAVEQTLASGARTADLGGSMGCRAFAEATKARL
ncbi:MAG: 3-isopropylmalate dehydrogenase [Pseudomonadota bacterium]|nr:3-isopropylmalate dehydrogenase [Pseudomonadota bacterium]